MKEIRPLDGSRIGMARSHSLAASPLLPSRDPAPQSIRRLDSLAPANSLAIRRELDRPSTGLPGAAYSQHAIFSAQRPTLNAQRPMKEGTGSHQPPSPGSRGATASQRKDRASRGGGDLRRQRGN